MGFQFGDVCFDPTLLIIVMAIPFIPIIGVNHHYQTVIFGLKVMICLDDVILDGSYGR